MSLRFRLFLTAWIVVFSVAVGVELYEIHHTSATVTQLEKTNCVLRQFLTSAEISRRQAASRETGMKKALDEKAVKAYKTLADSFIAIGKCTILVAPPLKAKG